MGCCLLACLLRCCDAMRCDVMRATAATHLPTHSLARPPTYPPRHRAAAKRWDDARNEQATLQQGQASKKEKAKPTPTPPQALVACKCSVASQPTVPHHPSTHSIQQHLAAAATTNKARMHTIKHMLGWMGGACLPCPALPCPALPCMPCMAWYTHTDTQTHTYPTERAAYSYVCVHMQVCRVEMGCGSGYR